MLQGSNRSAPRTRVGRRPSQSGTGICRTSTWQSHLSPDVTRAGSAAGTTATSQSLTTRSVQHTHQDGLTPARAKPILAVGAPLYMVLTAIADTLFDPPYGILNRVGAVINPSLQPVNNHEQNASHGTLVLDQGGRSKYLGPTAGSEWLKDVR